MLNPRISHVDTLSKNYGYKDNKELLIPRLHLIWIGSISLIDTKYMNNVKKWVNMIFDCKFYIFLV